jgi:Fe-Mn family superoxide dismutase
MMTRRQALKTAALATGIAAAASRSFAQSAPVPTGTPQPQPFTLPPLPYPADALEPHIDGRTMEIHHGRHHKAYVDNLNKAIVDAPQFNGQSLEVMLMKLDSLPEKIRNPIRNNGGGHFNHSLFWQMIKKDGGGEPQGELAKAIDVSFGNFANFRTKFTEAATKVFGSGWAWLIMQNGVLTIESAPNQDAPLSLVKQPILGLDVWEHAYYLKYQNKRADYIAAWWNVANWDFVAERFASASK